MSELKRDGGDGETLLNIDTPLFPNRIPMSEGKFKPDDVVGTLKAWRTKDHKTVCPEIYFEDLLPKIQSALQEGEAWKERWKKLRIFLEADSGYEHADVRALEYMNELQKG